MVDTRPVALEKARRRAEELQARRDALQENSPVQTDSPFGSGFESERQRAKSALRSEIESYDGTGVHKIEADAERQQEERILNVAAYCRVSTDDIEQTISIEMQKKNYREKIRANPKWKYCGLYVERYSLSLIQMHPQPILGCISLGAGCIQGCKDASLSVELYKLHKRDASRALRAEL